MNWECFVIIEMCWALVPCAFHPKTAGISFSSPATLNLKKMVKKMNGWMMELNVLEEKILVKRFSLSQKVQFF